MQFNIFPNPSEMMDEIRKRNAEKGNSARIVAGFCWPRSAPNPDGSLVNDVRMGGFAMPWEKKDMFEFDYIGVIFGNDLVYDASKRQWQSVSQRSHDTQVKRKESAHEKPPRCDSAVEADTNNLWPQVCVVPKPRATLDAIGDKYDIRKTSPSETTQ